MGIDRESQIAREKIVLLCYGLYTLGMTLIAYMLHWREWVIPVILGGYALCVAQCWKGYRSYFFRAMFITACCWMNVSIYLMHASSFSGTFSTICAEIILLAIFCVPQNVYIEAVVFTIHLINHLFFIKDIRLSVGRSGIQMLLRVLSVYVTMYVTYQLVKAQVEANSKMAKNMEAIQRAEQSKDDFMSNISHEIRTPVNTVCGISEIVLRDENLPAGIRDNVYDIQIAGRNLLSLVSDILDFTELQSGKMELIPDVYNVTSTVNDLIGMAVAKIGPKPLEFIVDCDANIPSGLIGDEQKIRRAILNILDNAIKFTQEGGIILSVTTREEEYGVNLIVTVRDTGVGMKRETLEKIFTSFNQVDTKRNRQTSGLGLGLNIAKALTNKMGGFISVRSLFGTGTKIQLTIPQKVLNPEPIIVLENAKKIRVLLYIDMEKYQNTMVREGYEECIAHIASGLGVFCRPCRNLGEFQRRLAKDDYTHAFISWREYCEDRAYFEGLAERMPVVLVLEHDHRESVEGKKMLYVYKPFYALSIAAILNGQYHEAVGQKRGHRTRFTAPEAAVLVVDDNLMNLKVVEGLLRPYQIKVYTAESGKECLRKLEGVRVDMVFMDHMMPEMDGVETLRQIRSRPVPYFRNVPVVALTANAIGGAREMFLGEGFADYVTKPIEISTLERVLRKFIPESMIVKGGEIEERPAEAPEEADGALCIEGVDVGLGLSYCNAQMDDYLEIVRIYYNIGLARLDDIQKYYESRDWKNYTILIHAVKSTSLNIGAKDLSDKAKALEAAGREEDESFLLKNHDRMQAEYGQILTSIGANRTVFPDGGDKPLETAETETLRELDYNELMEKLGELASQLDTFEMEAVNACMEGLLDCRYQDKPLKEMLAPVEEKIGAFDFMSAGEELASLRQVLEVSV